LTVDLAIQPNLLSQEGIGLIDLELIAPSDLPIELAVSAVTMAELAAWPARDR